MNASRIADFSPATRSRAASAKQQSNNSFFFGDAHGLKLFADVTSSSSACLTDPPTKVSGRHVKEEERGGKQQPSSSGLVGWPLMFVCSTNASAA